MESGLYFWVNSDAKNQDLYQEENKVWEGKTIYSVSASFHLAVENPENLPNKQLQTFFCHELELTRNVYSKAHGMCTEAKTMEVYEIGRGCF